MMPKTIHQAYHCLLFCLLLFCFLVVSYDAAAQGSVTLSGQVKDEEGVPLPGVLVNVIGDKGIKSVTTDPDGRFTVTGLVPGTYEIKPDLSGYVAVETTQVEIGESGAEVNIAMRLGGLQETMVVSASKVETRLINAPATMSVLSGEMIENSPAENYADLLRSVPGLNVVQTSARDINLTSRQASSTLATSQLALLDGRTIYQDFFGFILWDFLPIDFDEIKQIEVIRGPASAVWGANAQTGVVNILTKSPREIVGTSFKLYGGFFDRDVEGGSNLDSGTSFGASVRHAQVLNDSWSYKLSTGYYTQDAFARPAGIIPPSTVPGTNIPTGGVPYSAVNFENRGTRQPKFDIRFDQELGRDSKLIYAGGVAGTEGIIHTGIGPFDIDRSSKLGYGKVNYNRGNQIELFRQFPRWRSRKSPCARTRRTPDQFCL